VRPSSPGDFAPAPADKPDYYPACYHRSCILESHIYYTGRVEVVADRSSQEANKRKTEAKLKKFILMLTSDTPLVADTSETEKSYKPANDQNQSRRKKTYSFSGSRRALAASRAASTRSPSRLKVDVKKRRGADVPVSRLENTIRNKKTKVRTPGLE